MNLFKNMIYEVIQLKLGDQSMKHNLKEETRKHTIICKILKFLGKCEGIFQNKQYFRSGYICLIP